MNMVKKIIVKLNFVNILSILFYLFRIFPINSNKIIFVSFHGKGYGDGGKYIAEHLLGRGLDIIWAIKDGNEKMPSGIRKVKISTVAYIYHLSTAKIWINNSRFPQYVRKRKKQYYIQLWHGCLALKKIEYDAYDKMTPYYKKWMRNDTDMTDLMVSNSKFCTEMFRRAFKYDGEILEIGTPRNDILVAQNHDIGKKAKGNLKIENNSKIILYAPTFRVNDIEKAYDIDLAAIKTILMKQTGKPWVVVVRLHPIVRNKRGLIKNIEQFVDATDYPDMQELIAASDMVITDYSSVMFEALIAKKPVLLYVKDLDKYKEERGTYFDIEQLPFLFAKNNDDVLSIMKNINNDNYMKKYEKFSNKTGINETSNSSKIISDKILKITSRGKG